MQILIKTIRAENAGLYRIKDGRRILFARPQTRIELYEDVKEIPVLGAAACKVRKRRAVLVLCSGIMAGMAELEDTLTFEMIADIQRPDGVYERMHFDRLIPQEIDLDGEWKFETELPKGWGNLWIP